MHVVEYDICGALPVDGRARQQLHAWRIGCYREQANALAHPCRDQHQLRSGRVVDNRFASVDFPTIRAGHGLCVDGPRVESA